MAHRVPLPEVPFRRPVGRSDASGISFLFVAVPPATSNILIAEDMVAKFSLTELIPGIVISDESGLERWFDQPAPRFYVVFPPLASEPVDRLDHAAAVHVVGNASRRIGFHDVAVVQ